MQSGQINKHFIAEARRSRGMGCGFFVLCSLFYVVCSMLFVLGFEGLGGVEEAGALACQHGGLNSGAKFFSSEVGDPFLPAP